MSREESPEDRKLVAVKSWFTRSSSSTTAPQNGYVSDEVSFGTSTPKEGVVESEAGFTSLRSQLSMRTSRGSGETEKEGGAGSSALTIRNITPLTPLTPLKWKSNSREQEEEEKERSRLGSAVAAGTIYELCPGGKPVAENGKEERAAEGQHQVSPVAKADVKGATSTVDELSTSIQDGITDEDVSLESLEGPGRKPSSGDDVMMLTIDFLRARLQSERSASKTAKLRIQQLAEKVSELEEKLDLAIEDRKRAEASAQEALMKLRLAESSNQGMNRISGEVSDRSISTSTKGSPLSRSTAAREDTKYTQLDGSSNKDLSRTISYGISVEDRDSRTKRQISETVSKTEERTAEQDRVGVRPVPQNMLESSQELPQKQESRAVIESRLQNMWNKISEDMIALAEERREDFLREELMSWMGQGPIVLQNILHDVDLRSESERIGLQGVARPIVESQPELSSEIVQHKGQQQAEPERAPLLHEQFAAQERNYHESPRKMGHFKGDDLYASSSPTGHRELQIADNKHGPNGVVDNSPFLGFHLASLAKSKSTLDLSTRSNGLAEDGYRSSKPDFRDDRDRRNSGLHQQAQTRDSEREEPYSSSQPENAHRHRHQRSHSDNNDWPAVEDYGFLNQQPEPSPRLGRRQSYSGYPPSMAADPRRTSFEKPHGSYDDLRYGVERIYGANGQRRNSFLAAKANNAPGKLNSNQTSINGYSNAEPTLSLGYGPAYDAPPREHSPVQQSPKAGIDKNISDVLRALQLAKATIQNGGAGRFRS